MSAVAVNKQSVTITSAALWFDLAALALVAFGNAMLAARISAEPLALGLVICAMVVRLVQVRTKILAIPLQIPFLLFLVSAWLGVTVSYDPALSLRKFELIVGSIALYYVLATTQTDLAKRAVVWGLLALGAGAALFFATQTDFAQEPIKLGALNEIGLLLNRITPQLGQHTPHANLMAGIMLIALPYAVTMGADALKRKNILIMIACAVLGAVIAFGLVMTTSRGALLALVLLLSIGTFLYLCGRLAKRAGYSPGIGVAAAINLGLIIFLLAVIVGRNQIGAVLNASLGSVSGVPRLELYNQVLQLIQDYAITGAGLDTFSPHFSTYELLINVPFLPHAHNMLLEVWFEQGILGLVAFVWLIVGYYIWVVRRRGRMNWLALAGAAAFTMVLLHGMVDVVFYFSRVVSLMFIPLGLTVCALEPFVSLETSEARGSRKLWLAGAVAGGLVLLLVLGLMVVRRDQMLALWTANQGALKQAQIELPLVAYPKPTPNEVRRNADLSQADALFTNALGIDSTNRTAQTRLGLIALDKMDFPIALGHLRAAYNTDQANHAVVKALGYTYVWSGQLEQAKPLLAQIPEAAEELGYASFDWRERDRDDLAALSSRMVQLLTK